jgi:hypothetical protein
LIELFSVAPALLYEIELAVKLQQENEPKTTSLTCSSKNSVDILEIQLIVNKSAAAAVQCRWGTFEVFALST